jgi:hypothetical protein
MTRKQANNVPARAQRRAKEKDRNIAQLKKQNEIRSCDDADKQ